MKKIGMCGLLLCLTVLCLFTAGCGENTSSAASGTAASAVTSQIETQKPTVVAQITAVRGNKLTLARYKKAEPLPESAASNLPTSSEPTSSRGTSSAKTSSVYLTMDQFDLALYQLTEETMVYDLGKEPCVLIMGENGWTAGTAADLIVGDSIVIIDDAVAGEGVWRIYAIARPTSSAPAA